LIIFGFAALLSLDAGIEYLLENLTGVAEAPPAYPVLAFLLSFEMRFLWIVFKFFLVPFNEKLACGAA
jgi:hypothetical protein